MHFVHFLFAINRQWVVETKNKKFIKQLLIFLFIVNADQYMLRARSLLSQHTLWIMQKKWKKKNIFHFTPLLHRSLHQFNYSCSSCQQRASDWCCRTLHCVWSDQSSSHKLKLIHSFYLRRIFTVRSAGRLTSQSVLKRICGQSWGLQGIEPVHFCNVHNTRTVSFEISGISFGIHWIWVIQQGICAFHIEKKMPLVSDLTQAECAWPTAGQHGMREMISHQHGQSL